MFPLVIYIKGLLNFDHYIKLIIISTCKLPYNSNFLSGSKQRYDKDIQNRYNNNESLNLSQHLCWLAKIKHVWCNCVEFREIRCLSKNAANITSSKTKYSIKNSRVNICIFTVLQQMQHLGNLEIKLL